MATHIKCSQKGKQRPQSELRFTIYSSIKQFFSPVIEQIRILTSLWKSCGRTLVS